MTDFLSVKTNLMAPSALQRYQHQRRFFAAAARVSTVARAAFVAKDFIVHAAVAYAFATAAANVAGADAVYVV